VIAVATVLGRILRLPLSLVPAFRGRLVRRLQEYSGQGFILHCGCGQSFAMVANRWPDDRVYEDAAERYGWRKVDGAWLCARCAGLGSEAVVIRRRRA